jgi:hypothetical protein
MNPFESSWKRLLSGPADEGGEIRDILDAHDLALEGSDGVIAVLKAYMDESGVHDGSPICTVAAYMGRPQNWQEFAKKWKPAKRPINVFHAADCANLRGEFEGWDKTKRDEYVAKLLPVLTGTNLPGIVVGIDIREFGAAIAGRDDLGQLFGTPYSACFHWVTQIIMLQAFQAGSAERIGFIHETNDFAGQAAEAFNYIKKFGNPYGTAVSLQFGGKEDYLPLQAADILAYEGNKRLRDVSKPERRAWTALDPDKTRLQCWYYGKNNIGNLVRQLEAIKEGMLLKPMPSKSWIQNFPEVPNWPFRA